MRCRVIFYGLGEKWDEEIVSEGPLTCQKAAEIVLQMKGREASEMRGLIYFIGNDRLMADAGLSDGDVLTIRRLLGGG